MCDRTHGELAETMCAETSNTQQSLQAQGAGNGMHLDALIRRHDQLPFGQSPRFALDGVT